MDLLFGFLGVLVSSWFYFQGLKNKKKHQVSHEDTKNSRTQFFFRTTSYPSDFSSCPSWSKNEKTYMM